MLKLFITPTSIVFEDMNDTIYTNLVNKYNLEFVIEDDEYKIVDEPQYLFKLLYKLTCDYDIELG